MIDIDQRKFNLQESKNIIYYTIFEYQSFLSMKHTSTFNDASLYNRKGGGGGVKCYQFLRGLNRYVADILAMSERGG